MTTRWCAGRRALLAGAGAAALLTACGDDPEPAAATGTAPETTGTTPETATPTAAAPLAQTADVPVGGGKIVEGVLVTQPTAGTFKAFDAACPHKGVLVAAPKDGVATCLAHNSTFAIADGARMAGPATSGLKEIAIKVDGDRISRA